MTDPAPVDATVTDRRRSLITDILWGSGAALASLLLAAWKVGAPASLPWLWAKWDLTSTYAVTRALGDYLWISPNPDLAFPFGQNLAGFPATDVLNVLALKVLVLLTQDPLVAVNLFLVLCFPLIVAAMYLFLRFIRVTPPLAAVLAFALSLLPWHFDRFIHAGLANYSSVAIGLILIVILLERNLRLGGPDGGQTITFVGALAAALYVGLTGTYYAVFTTLLALTALLFQVFLGRRDRGLIAAFWLAILPFLTTAAVTVVYGIGAPEGSDGSLDRGGAESQMFGGAMFTLLRTTGLWSEAWPIRGLNDVPTLIGTFEADARNSTVGLVAVILAFVCAGLVLAANGRVSVPRFVSSLTYWPWLFLVSVLFFTTSAFGQVFSVFFLYQIRSWGRFSIVVLAISFAILGLTLTYLASGRRRRAVVAIASISIVAVTIVDTVSLSEPFDREAAQSEAQELRSYGAALDTAVPRDCALFTMPSYLFPEGVPEDGTATYDPQLPYLFAHEPRWSYGGVRGTEAGQWQYDTISRDVPTLVQQVVAAGFCGIHVDTRAYRNDASPLGELGSILGAPVATSDSGRWVTYLLGGASSGTFTPDNIFDATTAHLSMGFDEMQVVGSAESGTLTAGTGFVRIANPRANAASGIVEVDVSPVICTLPQDITLSAGTDSITLPLTSDLTLELPVDVPAESSISARITTPDGCQVEVRNPRFIPGA